MATTIPHSLEPARIAPYSERIGPRVAAATRAFLNEAQKSLWLLWRQRLVVFLELIALAAFYPFLQFVIGNGTIDKTLVPPTLLAFLTYPVLFIVTLKLAGDLLEEVNSGTFEQMHLSPFSPAWLLVGRMFTSVIEGVLIAIGIAAGTACALGISLPLPVAGAVPAALTVVDIVGFALVIGGLSLRLPQIGSLVHLLNGLIFVLNGTLIPVNLYPGWVQGIAQFVPTTLGIEATRKVVLEGPDQPLAGQAHLISRADHVRRLLPGDQCRPGSRVVQAGSPGSSPGRLRRLHLLPHADQSHVLGPAG
ncbi:MAG: ABC transporter permease [Chloroflexota bacterium]